MIDSVRFCSESYRFKTGEYLRSWKKCLTFLQTVLMVKLRMPDTLNMPCISNLSFYSVLR